MICVFVYGTLLVGEANHHIAAPYLLKVEDGEVYGQLYDCGSYPAMVRDEGPQLVYGEWFTVTEEGLAAMDVLEEYYGPGADNDYERVWIRDAYNNQKEGWVYVWNDSRGCLSIPEGSWRSFRQKKRA
ncbi:MAG: hypothetical protein K0S39_2323 [Paenibacillus sp.]|jgi:gamma-glutamylcyclotransferase (GGCT)/AIG2-like uncharacterized protein YtfP|nr:hypothetical protein [Paenibacillus sp.]